MLRQEKTDRNDDRPVGTDHSNIGKSPQVFDLIPVSDAGVPRSGGGHAENDIPADRTALGCATRSEDLAGGLYTARGR